MLVCLKNKIMDNSKNMENIIKKYYILNIYLCFIPFVFWVIIYIGKLDFPTIYPSLDNIIFAVTNILALSFIPSIFWILISNIFKNIHILITIIYFGIYLFCIINYGILLITMALSSTPFF